MVPMMVRVSVAMAFPQEGRPTQSQQRDQSYRAEDNEPFDHGEVAYFSKVPVSSSASVPAAIFKRCIR